MPATTPRDSPQGAAVPDGLINDHRTGGHGARTGAEALRERGYATFGLSANALLVDNLGYGQGFDYC